MISKFLNKASGLLSHTAESIDNLAKKDQKSILAKSTELVNQELAMASKAIRSEEVAQFKANVVKTGKNGLIGIGLLAGKAVKVVKSPISQVASNVSMGFKAGMN